MFCNSLDNEMKSNCGMSYGAIKRIIGGNEIAPHSEPWLVPLCMSKWYSLIS